MRENATPTMRELVRQKDWSLTPLGPIERWPNSLTTLVELCLASRFPTVIFWGEERVQIYNDGYRIILGAKHPAALGQRAADCWSEIWHLIRDMMVSVFQEGEAVWVEASQFSVERSGYLEEAYFTFSYTPARDETGHVGGIFETVAEVTEQVVSHRRLAVLRELGEHPVAHDYDTVCRNVTTTLGRHTFDIPFALVYLLTDDSDVAHLAGTSHVDAAQGACPGQIHLADLDPWRLHEARHQNQPLVLTDLPTRFEPLPGGPWPEPAHTAVVLPLSRAGTNHVCGFLIVGISPRRVLDDAYLNFLQLTSLHVSRMLNSVDAYQQERHRAERLAELDRIKTTFFSNVSHEFRTPLTLILGHLEVALERPDGSLQGDELDAVYRNAARLLRLVNSLLDFSRLESGRQQARFTPTDLAAFTTDLASAFRSTIERAGLQLMVECASGPDPIYVDTDMWEKIVLNLISNAFKFTRAGHIQVSLRTEGDWVELVVADTGCGIPAAELPHMFERFHRVEGAFGRSFEGSGIGLSLVHEFAHLHGGAVSVESTEGVGSRFTVRLRTGSAHLPPERLGNPTAAPSPSSTLRMALDTESWLQHDKEPDHASAQAGIPTTLNEIAASSTILVADDNADMRTYLTRMLSPHWRVELAEDGESALLQIRNKAPDLVLSDVMMPKLNGIELLQQLRNDPVTANIPVILLSARAGEEAVLEGITIGADDYMSKPFSARELIARVRTHLSMAQQRVQWAKELERVNKELEAFSYSVSHDLRAPLRAIGGFTGILDSRLGNLVGPQERHYLDVIRESVQRMGQIIDDLLSLARINKETMQREPVSLSELAQHKLDELSTRDPGRKVTVLIAPAMMPYADQRLLSVMLDNLLGNAWKFTAKRHDAQIEVGVETSDGETRFYIRDNGAGFDMTYAHQLFAPFQRLHAESDFSGTGIGLSIVHRIVSRHGGRIWAEAAVNQGATFYFTLGG